MEVGNGEDLTDLTAHLDYFIPLGTFSGRGDGKA
jgi:hypothetical protein